MRLLLCFLFCILLTAGCKKDEKTTEFKLNYESEATIKAASPVSLPFEFFTPPVTTNSESEFEGRNSNLSLIKTVYLGNLDLAILSPEGKNFSFLKNIYIYISAEGLDDKLIASKENIDDSVGPQLSLNPTGENLKDYIKQKTFSIKLKAVTDETITEDIRITIDSRYNIKAGLRK